MDKEIRLRFPGTGGGSEDGFNDSGIETFEGNTGDYVAREAAQNAIDAGSGGIVHISFELVEIDRKDIPGIQDLRAVLKACGQYYGNNPKVRSFCTRATKILAKPKIKALRISDYGTHGLSGTDEDRDGAWYGLVRSKGVSNKYKGQGGSYGIGKFAPFAASELRTVLYSTCLPDGDTAFQGVAVLCSHQDSLGKTMQGTGYIGHFEPKTEQFMAVRDRSSIPARFLREEPGTDVWALAYKDADSEDWKRDLMKSLLSNFWPAVMQKLVSFSVGRELIDANNLEKRLLQFSSEPGFEAHRYFAAVKHADHRCFVKEFELLGRVSLYLTVHDDSLPKRVALSRKTGMIVEEKRFRSRMPFVGFLECTDEKGNEFFRSMEPPRHDTWDEKRLPKYTGHRSEFRAFLDWIRGCIGELNPTINAESFDAPELKEFLPDEGEDEPGDANNEQDKNEVAESETPFLKKAPVGPLQVKKLKAVDPKKIRVSSGGGNETEDSSGEGEEGEGIPDPKNPDSETKGGKNEKSGGGSTDPRSVPDPLPDLRTRFIQRNGGECDLFLRSDGRYEGDVRICIVGETGGREAAEIVAASIDGRPLEFRGSRLKGIVLDSNVPTSISVRLKSSERIALDCELL